MEDLTKVAHAITDSFVLHFSFKTNISAVLYGVHAHVDDSISKHTSTRANFIFRPHARGGRAFEVPV